MSVVYVEETFDREGSHDSAWKRTYRRSFVVVTDDEDDGAKTVREGLPVAIGNSFAAGNDVDEGSFCVLIRTQCVSADGLQWVATCEYGPYDANEKPANPLERPIELSWDGAQFERIADIDADGKPIVNSAGDLFDPPVTIDDSRPILSITRNERYFDPDLADMFRDAVNLDEWFGFPPETVKVAKLVARLTKDQDIGYFYVVSYEFAINRDGWVRKILDQGFRELNGDGTATKAIVDKKGQPLSAASLLNGEGKKLAVGSEPVSLEFKTYKRVSFALLNLTREMIPGNAA